MESWNPFANFSYASPVTGASNGQPPEDSFADDPDSILDSIRRAKAIAAATNAECDPAPPPSPARSTRSARSNASTNRSNEENGCIEVDIDAGPHAPNIDLDGDGRLDFHEFYTAACNHNEIMTKSNINALFNVLDHNQDNLLDVKDLIRVLPTNLNKTGKVRNRLGPFFETNDKAATQEEND